MGLSMRCSGRVLVVEVVEEDDTVTHSSSLVSRSEQSKRSDSSMVNLFGLMWSVLGVTVVVMLATVDGDSLSPD